MCLYASNIKPLKAEKDLTIIKCIIPYGNGKYKSPAQETTIELNKTLVAEGNVAKLPNDYSSNEIGVGVIHAYIDSKTFKHHFNSCKFVKAIIKAGTELYVQFDGEEVAAKEIFITDNFINEDNLSDYESELEVTRQELVKLLRNQVCARANNGAKIGDIYTHDKRFIQPAHLTADMKPIGVVSYIRSDGEPHIIGLRQSEEMWCVVSASYGQISNTIDSLDKAINNDKGQEYTEILKERFADKLKDFPALNYCLEYETDGTNKGDWFFMSSGETLQTIRNAFIINTSIERINEIVGKGIAEPIEYGTWYWTVTSCGGRSAWRCYSGRAHIDNWNNHGNLLDHMTRPALSIA